MAVAHANLSALKQGRPWEYVLRFALGGLATVAAGLVADAWGPAVGGLFLAFPAIFAASSTLVERHERQKKTKQGLRGNRRGRDAAALEARGALYGCAGMFAFSLAIWALTTINAAVAFVAAVLLWAGLAYLVWSLARHL